MKHEVMSFKIDTRKTSKIAARNTDRGDQYRVVNPKKFVFNRKPKNAREAYSDWE